MTDAVLRGKADVDHLADIEVVATVEVGRTTMPLKEAMQLQVGDSIVLPKLAGEAFEVRMNGQLFGHGEIVVITDMMACRFTGLEQPVEAKEGA